MVDVRPLADEKIDQFPDLGEMGYINASQLAAQVQQGRVSPGIRRSRVHGHGRVDVRPVLQQGMRDLQRGFRGVQVQGLSLIHISSGCSGIKNEGNLRLWGIVFSLLSKLPPTIF